MRFVNWNISYAGDIENKFNYLRTVITKDTCVMLQEVKPYSYEYIKEQLQSGEDNHRQSIVVGLRTIRKHHHAIIVEHPSDEGRNTPQAHVLNQENQSIGDVYQPYLQTCMNHRNGL